MKRILLLICVLCLVFTSWVYSQSDKSMDIEKLAQKFNEPDHSAKPWVYWMWMNGNISKKGITADLEAMQDVGIGGVMMFNIGGLVPEGKIDYGTEEWLDMVKHAAKTANELGISFVMHNCDGWSSSGGPWVTKDNAMKKIVFSEIQIAGGESYNQALPLPQSNLNYYKDIAILAFPKPAKDIRIPNIKEKAGFVREFDLTIGSDVISDEGIIKSTDILDLSQHLSEEGILKWNSPKGKDWTILRLGYTLTGRKNSPATAYGTGLECDKLSKEAFSEHWEFGIQPKIDEMGKGHLTGILLDSYEAGTCNWTAKMQEEFENRRGYDLLKWLPAVSGRYINSVKETESFLWDFRKTIADLYKDNFYHHAATLANNEGQKFYVEPYEGAYDCLQVGAAAQEVIGECWTNASMIHWNKVASSAAHTNNIKMVGCEVFTADGFNGRWLGHPRSLKSIGDRVWSEGVNHFIIHRYIHQPWENVRPGQSLGPYGTHFERTNTWWKQSKAWISYITRAQQVLQQGRFVADIALIADEGMPSHGTYRPDIKLKGYDYDIISAQHVPNFQYINNEFVLPSGARYKALVFPESEYLTLSVLEKIKELTDIGATVIASKPLSSPSISDSGDLKKYEKLVAEIFDGNRGVPTTVGVKGKVIWRKNIDEIVAALNILPDFDVSKKNIEIAWTHRKLEEDHIYFVSSQMKEPINTECKFKIKRGYEAEIWRPETGDISKIKFNYTKDERAMLNLDFQPEEAYFVVFKEVKDATTDQYVAISKVGGGVSERKVNPLSELKIESAQFGIFEIKHKNMVDVCQTIRQKVKNNGLSVLSSNQLGGDPAPGGGKTLWVEYMQDGKTFNSFTREKRSLVIPPSDKKIKILRAMYGRIPENLDDIPKYDFVDISNKVKNLVENGRLKFKPMDLLKDEIHGDASRQISISYLADGVAHELIADLDEMINLPSEAWRSQHPFPELKYKNGQQFAIAWESGQYELESGSGRTKIIQVENIPEEKLIDGEWEVYFPTVAKGGETVVFDGLNSYTKHKNESIRYFSGTASYSKEIHVPLERFSEDLDIWLDLGRVECIAEVTINGKRLTTLWKEPYRVNITDFVTPGVNKLKVDITNLLVNRLIGDEQYPENYEYKADIITEYPLWLDDSYQQPESPRKTFSVAKLWKQDDELVNSGLLGPVVLKSFISVGLD
ncbi:MAG: hypothetical protein KAS71_09905 [Bacteroidales bacterium]|nr:hypothetical protein [Bacteroidales bacterium]